jgi:hypothetical protein
MLMVTENGTACAPGVIVVGWKVQVPLGGSVLCKQESAMGWPGAPVFSFNRREYIAVPPGEAV